MFALYASFSRLTSVRSDSGRFDSFVMVMFSPWYAESQTVLRGSESDFVPAAFAGSSVSFVGRSEVGSGVSIVFDTEGAAGTSLAPFLFSPKLVGSSRLRMCADLVVWKLRIECDRLCKAWA